MGRRNEKVFALLEEQKKKYKDIADTLGISKSAVTYWKKNGTDPTYEQCQKLAPLFGVSVEYLWNDEETKETNNTFTIDLANLDGERRKFAGSVISLYTSGNCSDDETFHLVYQSVVSNLELIQRIIRDGK